MAEPTLIEQIEALLPKSGEIRFKLPTKTLAQKACGLHQVVWLIARPNDIDVVIELQNTERDMSTDKVVGLDEIFTGYVNDSELLSAKMGKLKFVRKADGLAWWPLRYALSPTFAEKDFESVATFEARLQTLKEGLDQKPRPSQIILSWTLIEQALASGQRVDYKDDFGRHANLYQAVKVTDKESVLWVATLPRRDDRQSPNRDGCLKVSPDQGGVVVQLTASWVAYLQRFMVDDGVAKELRAFADAYYAQ